MRIYVDFDDCLCETARSFTKIVSELFGKNIPYEEVHFFNLKESFGLNDEEYEELMAEGHRAEILLSYEETPGASRVLNELMDRGYEVCVITGREGDSYDISRRWLNEHGLERAKLYFLNKYGRGNFKKNSSYNLELDDFYKMDFDYAVEDSPLAFTYLDRLEKTKVLIFDRPWNRNCELAANYMRCPGWEYIREKILKDGG